MEFIPELLKSISEQTFRDFHVLIIDNGSSDGVEAFVRANYPQVTFLRNARNLGFSPAHNQAIRYAIDRWEGDDLADRFLLVTNPDVIFSATFLEELMKGVVAHPTVGSFQGKLMRAMIENGQDEALKETVKSDLIDSTGLVLNRNRTCTDRGAGELDTGQFDAKNDLFGVTGALALYRANALKEIGRKDEYFDTDFFLYKEDVDLAWRLDKKGWKARFVPSAVAYHHRGAFGKEKMNWIERIRNRRRKSSMRNWYSTRNHILLLVKNQPFWSGVVASPWIFWFEIRRFVYTCLFEPRNLSAYLSAIGLVPRMLKKRFTKYP